MARQKNDTPFSLFSFQDIITATTGILILLSLILAISVITQGAESVVGEDIADESLIAEQQRMQNKVQHQGLLLAELTRQGGQMSVATPSSLKKEIAEKGKLLLHLETQVAESSSDLLQQQKTFAKLKSSKSYLDQKASLEKTTKQIEAIKRQLAALNKTGRLKFNFRNTTRAPWLVEITGNQILAAKVNTIGKPRQFKTTRSFKAFADNVPKSQQYFVLLVKPSGVTNYEDIRVHLESEKADIGVDVIAEDQSAIDLEKGASF